jgi:hypothetical protein
MSEQFLEDGPGHFLVRAGQVQRQPDGSISAAEMLRIAALYQPAFDAAMEALERGDNVQFQRVGAKETDEHN